VTKFIDKGKLKEQLGYIQEGNIKDGDLMVLYSWILKISFGHPSADILNDAFHIIVDVIVLIKTPLHHTDYLHLLPVKATTLDFTRKGLQSVMISGDTPQSNHQSFVDFLTDPTVCPKKFLIDIIMGQSYQTFTRCNNLSIPLDLHLHSSLG
jgi:hypothetical protein